MASTQRFAAGVFFFVLHQWGTLWVPDAYFNTPEFSVSQHCCTAERLNNDFCDLFNYCSRQLCTLLPTDLECALLLEDILERHMVPSHDVPLRGCVVADGAFRLGICTF